ncbi:hypothetical protein V1L52_08745 [Treponema sp. HNW]|uniref:hypothetical protein n=1 Tax=Treponema sp. HNW TaxID=3116654 RepID=UPI003D0C94F9
MTVLLRHRKKYLVLIICSLSLVYGFSLDIFSHTVNGAAIDMLPGNKVEQTELRFRGFYGGQLQIGKRLLLNAAVSAKTGNLFSDVRFRDIVSSANLDEASLMYRFKVENALAQWSIFAGEYEVPGSDSFIKKYFGTEAFSSDLIKKETGFETPALFPLNGVGTSFMIKYAVPLANAGYFYYNEKYGKKRLNADFRIAGVSNILISDFLFGLSLPFERKDANGNDVVMVIKRADIHAGLTFLIGGSPFFNLYMQAGLARLQTKPEAPEKIVDFSDLYFLFEPRFAAGTSLFSVSLFYFPEHVYKDIPYIDRPLGAALTVKSLPVEFRSGQGVFGCITSVSAANPLTGAFSGFSLASISLKAVPFADIRIRNGNFKILLPIRPLKYTQPKEAFSLSLSYTIRF